MDVHNPKSWKRTNFYDTLETKTEKTSEFTLAGIFNQLPRTTIYWFCFVSGNVGKHTIWVTSNSLHPNISLQVFHTVLYTFPMVLIMRICLTKNFSSLDHFLYSCDLNVWFKGDTVGRNYLLITLRGWKAERLLLQGKHSILVPLYYFEFHFLMQGVLECIHSIWEWKTRINSYY